MYSNTNKDNVRVRFAPSPTGPLHIGGVRTALYNYLFAKKHNGTFILRIEDTDQTRYVEGAEEYIHKALHWFGLHYDEGPEVGGEYGPYRQSERKGIYRKYADKLIQSGHAYYAFDTAEELDAMKAREQANGNHTPKYDHTIRMQMRNSLTLPEEEVERLVEANEDVIIRLCIPANEEVVIHDIVRGEVTFNTSELDDKVIIKNDGMPTYHMANIVDDHNMAITHVIRGEEWLSSTAHHILMYRFFGWTPPQFAHLPLILNPSGKGKLSKRDGAKFGFPVFPLEWNGADEVFEGFKSSGFLPEAVLNFLVLLGWNPGNDQEIMSLDEMVEAFSLERIVKSGARFDIEKAQWFNQQYIINKDSNVLLHYVRNVLDEYNIADIPNDYLLKAIDLMKERVTVLGEFYTNATFLFGKPSEYDTEAFAKKYDPALESHFSAMAQLLSSIDHWTSEAIETSVKGYVSEHGLKLGAIMPIIRIYMTGSMKGPDLFPTMELLGKSEVLSRWQVVVEA